MLTIQDTELMQLMHAQQSPSFFKQRDQLATVELPFESTFLLPATFSIIAIALVPFI